MDNIDLDKIESAGKLFGWVLIVFTAGYSLIWKTRRHSEQIKELEDVVFPNNPSDKLLTLSWHDRLSDECAQRRVRDLEILAAHIVAPIQKEMSLIREDLGKLHERTSRRRWDDTPADDR